MLSIVLNPLVVLTQLRLCYVNDCLMSITLIKKLDSERISNLPKVMPLVNARIRIMIPRSP